MSWNVRRLWELILHKYLTNIYLCWKFALPSTTLISNSGHFKRFQLNDLLIQLINLVNIFWYTPSSPSSFISTGLITFMTSLFAVKWVKHFVSSYTAHKMKFSIKDFFIFCAVLGCRNKNFSWINIGKVIQMFMIH